ncbi:hypothetical protein J6590_009384 [Homalodisca vitripennis]|nr:hypothetical protein J6590_009384 [Homalodisca vitripennis]
MKYNPRLADSARSHVEVPAYANGDIHVSEDPAGHKHVQYYVTQLSEGSWQQYKTAPYLVRCGNITWLLENYYGKIRKYMNYMMVADVTPTSETGGWTTWPRTAPAALPVSLNVGHARTSLRVNGKQDVTFDGPYRTTASFIGVKEQSQCHRMESHTTSCLLMGADTMSSVTALNCVIGKALKRHREYSCWGVNELNLMLKRNSKRRRVHSWISFGLSFMVTPNVLRLIKTTLSYFEIALLHRVTSKTILRLSNCLLNPSERNTAVTTGDCNLYQF